MHQYDRYTQCVWCVQHLISVPPIILCTFSSVDVLSDEQLRNVELVEAVSDTVIPQLVSLLSSSIHNIVVDFPDLRESKVNKVYNVDFYSS